MCPILVGILSVTSEIRRRKKEKTTAVKCKSFVIVMPCGLKRLASCIKSEIIGFFI